jgi:hypothetical protein
MGEELPTQQLPKENAPWGTHEYTVGAKIIMKSHVYSEVPNNPVGSNQKVSSAEKSCSWPFWRWEENWNYQFEIMAPLQIQLFKLFFPIVEVYEQICTVSSKSWINSCRTKMDLGAFSELTF